MCVIHKTDFLSVTLATKTYVVVLYIVADRAAFLKTWTVQIQDLLARDHVLLMCKWEPTCFSSVLYYVLLRFYFSCVISHSRLASWRMVTTEVSAREQILLIKKKKKFLCIVALATLQLQRGNVFNWSLALFCYLLCCQSGWKRWMPRGVKWNTANM